MTAREVSHDVLTHFLEALECRHLVKGHTSRCDAITAAIEEARREGRESVLSNMPQCKTVCAIAEARRALETDK